MTERLYTTSEVARVLGISRIAVFKLIKRKKILSEKLGKNFYIKRNDILLYAVSKFIKKYKKSLHTTVDYLFSKRSTDNLVTAHVLDNDH